MGVNVPDLARAKKYYDELMPMLGFEPFVSGEGEFSYRPAGGKIGTHLFFYESAEGDPGAYSRHRTGLQHLAFIVKSRAAVEEAHRWAVERGGEVVHPPREWPQYHAGYYAVFWLDPHGFMLEVVCHRDDSARA
ncbi:extradiol dioxygenase [Bailinhaonella thermotolerans]|uniref:Extradiol dioxygenase n=2 Tax=Bailinhaonella thermotolerans TaxID=1070861 RepID=A0A3A4BF50_9ACTN|nr:extradiol dioxygenase [Bailinhaonella thermotolerans]